ncbi:aspartate aminotransferase family protein [Jannaschia sp. Os4]|uniref:pyridoxal phosphate-dependent decarboxylase family protein n=1 Tax=Jannaschia sp. Os4 TaxID=2807617 RepID=UPI00193990D0|nr:pyridoxal-dependent decarboxylase [Jannaschia sp. Os4]MBM2575722.1 aspartate aminotransferase family protein [Jannaschia sp. Os4]
MPVFPAPEAVAALSRLDEPLPDTGRPDAETAALLREVAAPATVASTGPDYFGFVIGGTLPAARDADHWVTDHDQCAVGHVGSPAAAALERVAGAWVLDALDLPRGAAVAFGTSATAGGLSCLTAARHALLARQGWDFAACGLDGAPRLRLVVPETVHVTILKAARILGFGTDNLVRMPCTPAGTVDPARLPAFTDRDIVVLQAGEVNTGGFDPFAAVIPAARAAGAWVHVDGAFGLWARASARRALTEGVDGADSWTVDAHKWLQVPYDCGMAIVREPEWLARAMNAAAAYAEGQAGDQMHLCLEFSRRARGVPAWAALRSLGRDGIAAMVDRHCALAGRIADGLAALGLEVLNAPPPLNQVLARGRDDAETAAILAHVQGSGAAWFGPTMWHGRPAFRVSVSNWRTREAHADALVALVVAALDPSARRA